MKYPRQASRSHEAGDPKAVQGGSGNKDIDAPTIPSQAMFGQGREIVILHDGQTYYLRITRQNKLILTK